MDDEIVGFILFIGFILLGLGFGIGFICGNNGIVATTRQTLCGEFMKETSDYINCNTEGLEDVVKMIKELTNER